MCQALLELLLTTNRSFELRLKRTWNAPGQDGGSEKQPMWVLTSIFPEISEDGKMVEIIGCIIDIRYVCLRAVLSLVLTPVFQPAKMG
jgi:hypothetical protein